MICLALLAAASPQIAFGMACQEIFELKANPL